MAGDGNDLKHVAIRLGMRTIDDHFRIGHRMRIRAVNDPFRSESPRVSGGIGHVVFMRQKDVRNPAHPVEGLDQRLEIPRRIDQPVAIRMPHEEAVGAEGLF